MNVPDEFSSKDELLVRKFHKSSIVVVLLFVIIPWLLIAIPGERKGNIGELTQIGPGNFSLRAEHGWPAIHGVSVKCTGQYSVNDSLFRPRNTLAILYFREYQQALFVEGFWTNVDRWPIRYVKSLGWDKSKIFFEYRVHWLGLLINVCFVAAASAALFWYCEYRIQRNGSLWKITLAESFVLIFILCAVVAWFSAMNRFAKHQESQLEKFKTQIPNSAYKKIGIYRKDVLPTFVSRLLDYANSKYPLAPYLFKPISKVYLPCNPEIAAFEDELASIDLPFSLQNDRGVLDHFPADKIVEIISGMNDLKVDDYYQLKRAVNLKKLTIYSGHNLDESEAQRFVENLKSLKSLKSCHVNMVGSRDKLGVFDKLLKSDVIDSMEVLAVDSSLADLLLKHDIVHKDITVKPVPKGEFWDMPAQEVLDSLTRKGVTVITETVAGWFRPAF